MTKKGLFLISHLKSIGLLISIASLCASCLPLDSTVRIDDPEIPEPCPPVSGVGVSSSAKGGGALQMTSCVGPVPMKFACYVSDLNYCLEYSAPVDESGGLSADVLSAVSAKEAECLALSGDAGAMTFVQNQGCENLYSGSGSRPAAVCHVLSNWDTLYFPQPNAERVYLGALSKYYGPEYGGSAEVECFRDAGQYYSLE